MSSRRYNRRYILIGLILALIGAGGLFLPFVPFWFSEDLDTLQQLADASTPAPISVPASSSATAQRPDPELRNVANRLSIAGLSINMPLFESASASVLAKGGWVFPGTSTPDRGGNTVVFGHRFRYLPPISNTFFHLDKIAKGDEMAVAWKGAVYRYRVSDVKIIEPTDFSVLEPTDRPTITLITCAPLFSTKQRLVVIADLVP